MHPVVAIDGPSGAGKGTVARSVARALAWSHVDTGAMYRAVAWRAQRDGLALDAQHEAAVAAIAAGAALDLSAGRVVIDGQDVTAAIRTAEIDTAAAQVARLPLVRDALVERQRRCASEGPVVMEGRDIGTVVFPDAAVKIYLDAQPAVRAARRSRDAAHRVSASAGIEVVAGAMAARDALDRTRRASPLRQAPDATRIDTTDQPVEAVVEAVLGIVRDRYGAADC